MVPSFETLIGTASSALPSILIAWLVLRGISRLVMWMAIAAIAVGLGYLASTGALADLGKMLLAFLGPVGAPAPATP